MKRRSQRKLVLERETVRSLQGDALSRARGGRIWYTLVFITTSVISDTCPDGAGTGHA